MTLTQKVKSLLHLDRETAEKAPADAPQPQGEDEKHKRIIRDMERFFVSRKSLSEIRDECELPYPKDVIFNAVAVEILSETNDGRIEYLRNTAVCLVDYQKDVGHDPVTLLGISDRDMLEWDGGKLMDKHDPISRISMNPQREKYLTLRHAAETELRHVLCRLTAVEELRNRTAAAQGRHLASRAA